MEIECFEHSIMDSDEEMAVPSSNWNYVPDSILLHIFQFFSPKELLHVGQTSKVWNRISYDEMLWKRLFYQKFKIDPKIGIMPGKRSWLCEYKRLIYDAPTVCSETLEKHDNQVLHVSFSHNGTMFATSSKDGFIIVWDSGYPAKVKYLHDMKDFRWKYTQFSQFNQTDTLLLVSGVHFGTPQSTSGEIAVFEVVDGFELQCRVVNKPYDIFGTWYSDRYLISGDLYWLAHLVSTTGLWLNKASQETQSEHTPIMSQLYRFYNRQASSVRAVMVANCLSTAALNTVSGAHDWPVELEASKKGNPPSHTSAICRSCTTNMLHEHSHQHRDDALDGGASSIQYEPEYRQVETERKLTPDRSDSEEGTTGDDESDSSESSESSEVTLDEDDLANQPDKLLLFTMGSKTYTPHQIGFKRIKGVSFPVRLDPGPSLAERIQNRENRLPREDPDWLNYQAVADKFDTVDHFIDLHGHIIGMGLSPDHRYLYVNSRPWPKDYYISNPLNPPPIAQEIDIHVIDLVTLQEVGKMLRAHKAYTPNHECFFIFLDVSNEHVASGAEDKHGYLWDRYYGICLAKLPHSDVVNSVAFNPQDPGMLVTTSDDYTVKVWRSRASLDRLVGQEMAATCQQASPTTIHPVRSK